MSRPPGTNESWARRNSPPPNPAARLRLSQRVIEGPIDFPTMPPPVPLRGSSRTHIADDLGSSAVELFPRFQETFSPDAAGHQGRHSCDLAI